MELVEIVESKYLDADNDPPHSGPPLVPGAAPPTLSPLAAAGPHAWQPAGAGPPLSYATTAFMSAVGGSASGAAAAAAAQGSGSAR